MIRPIRVDEIARPGTKQLLRRLADCPITIDRARRVNSRLLGFESRGSSWWRTPMERKAPMLSSRTTPRDPRPQASTGHSATTSPSSSRFGRCRAWVGAVSRSVPRSQSATLLVTRRGRVDDRVWTPRLFHHGRADAHTPIVGGQIVGAVTSYRKRSRSRCRQGNRENVWWHSILRALRGASCPIQRHGPLPAVPGQVASPGGAAKFRNLPGLILIS